MKILYINTFNPYVEVHGGATVARRELELMANLGQITPLFGEPLKLRYKNINFKRLLIDLLKGKSLKVASYNILHRPKSFYKQFDVIFCNHDLSAYDVDLFIELGKPFIVRKLNAEHLFFSEKLIFERIERNRIKRFEEKLGKTASAVIHVSATEFKSDYYSKIKHLLFPPLLSDAALNSSKIQSTYKHCDRPIDLLCITNYEWAPNREGFDWFFEHVYPLLPKSINIHLIGKGSVRYSIYESVTSYGYVKDVLPFYDQAKLFIAPVLSGAGIKIKNLEAMIYGIPLISTPVGVDGLGDIELVNGVTVVDNPKCFADKIVQMLANESRCLLQRSIAKDWIDQNVLAPKLWTNRIHEILEMVISE